MTTRDIKSRVYWMMLQAFALGASTVLVALAIEDAEYNTALVNGAIGCVGSYNLVCLVTQLFTELDNKNTTMTDCVGKLGRLKNEMDQSGNG